MKIVASLNGISLKSNIPTAYRIATLNLSCLISSTKDQPFLFLKIRDATSVFAGALFGFGIWDEIAYNKISQSQDYVQNVFGMDYTFENGLYLMAEYYFNDNGKSNKDEYRFEDWMNYFSNGDNLAKNYLYLGESFSLTELLDFSNYLIINLNDNSLNYSPWFSYSMSDNLELNVKADIPFGKTNSEFNQFEKNIFARIKFYF